MNLSSLQHELPSSRCQLACQGIRASVAIFGLVALAAFIGCGTLQQSHQEHHVLGRKPTGAMQEPAGFCETTWASLESNQVFYDVIDRPPEPYVDEPVLGQMYDSVSQPPAVDGNVYQSSFEVESDDQVLDENENLHADQETDDAEKYFFNTDE